MVKYIGVLMPLKYNQVWETEWLVSTLEVSSNPLTKCSCSIIKIANALRASIK